MPTSFTRARCARRALAVAPAVRSAAARPRPLPPQPVTVRIDNFTFGPAALTVAPGTTVTWINDDDIPHTVVADDKSFRSKALDTDDSFTFTFTSPATSPTSARCIRT